MRRIVDWRRPVHGLGIDFGSAGVKAVALSAERGELTVLGAGREPLPPGAVRDGAVRDADEAGATLGRLLARLKVRCRLLALAIGGSSVLVKRFPAPREGLAAGEGTIGFRDAVAREAARHVPFHLESLEFDYEGPVSPPPDPALGGSGGEESGSVVFGAAPREFVQAHCRAAAAAGRQVTRVELEPYALHAAARLADRLAGRPRESGAVVILDIGSSRAGVHVFRVFAGVPVGARDPAGNPRAMTDSPAELLASVPALGAGTLPAEGPERRAAPPDEPAGAGGHPGTDSQGGRVRDAEVFRNRIHTAVREALREAGWRKDFRLLLSGGGAAAPAGRLGLEGLASGDPVVLDPLQGLGRPDCGPAYAVAAGLAYQQILDRSGPGAGSGS